MLQGSVLVRTVTTLNCLKQTLDNILVHVERSLAKYVGQFQCFKQYIPCLDSKISITRFRFLKQLTCHEAIKLRSYETIQVAKEVGIKRAMIILKPFYTICSFSVNSCVYFLTSLTHANDLQISLQFKILLKSTCTLPTKLPTTTLPTLVIFG